MLNLSIDRLIGTSKAPPRPRGRTSSSARRMNMKNSALTTHTIQTSSGRISYIEAGSGPVALFVHGVLLNKHLWRRQLTGLSDIRRCIAVDLLAHDDTDFGAGPDVSGTASATLLREGLAALQIA